MNAQDNTLPDTEQRLIDLEIKLGFLDDLVDELNQVVVRQQRQIDLLMAEVEVRVKKRVKRQGRVEEMGELSIQFGSLDELNGLIEKLRG